MTKSTVSQWESTASNNTDVGGINIAEGCPAANVNNALREIMAQLAALYPNLTQISGITATAAEINYTDGVTGNIQTQLDSFRTAIEVSDWDNATDSGTYWSNATAANIPTAQFQRGIVVNAGTSDITQFLSSAANDRVHIRSLNSSGWTAWAEIPQLVDQDDMASDSATKAPSQQSVKAYVDGRTPLAEEYASAGQTITSAGSLTLAHGLGAKPRLLQFYLKCLTAEAGYSIGDEIIIPPGADVNTGASVFPDATNIRVRFGSNGAVFNAHNKTTGVNTNLTNANWNFYVRAWA